jgi:hypothetical protein
MANLICASAGKYVDFHIDSIPLGFSISAVN